MQVKPAKDDKAHLHDMLDSARQAVSYVRGQTFEQFWDDPKTRDAVAMRLTIVGEAAGRVSPAAAAAIPQVPFRREALTAMSYLDTSRFDHLSESEVLRRIGALLATAIARRGLCRPATVASGLKGAAKPSQPNDSACLVGDPLEQQIVRYLVLAGPASPRELGIALGLARRTVARKLARLRGSGYCEVFGKTKAARYRIRTEFSGN